MERKRMAGRKRSGYKIRTGLRVMMEKVSKTFSKLLLRTANPDCFAMSELSFSVPKMAPPEKIIIELEIPLIASEM